MRGSSAARTSSPASTVGSRKGSRPRACTRASCGRNSACSRRARVWRPGASGSASRSVSQWIWAQLEVDDDGLFALTALHEPRRSVAAGRPQPSALPTGRWIVDAPVEPLGVEPERVRHAQHDHLAVLQRDQAVVEITGRHRHVLAEAERVVLVDPRVVARLGAVLADPLEARARVLIEGPALGAVIAGGLRTVERPLALAAVEAADVAAPHRRPHDALLVDVGAADPEVGLG